MSLKEDLENPDSPIFGFGRERLWFWLKDHPDVYPKITYAQMEDIVRSTKYSQIHHAVLKSSTVKPVVSKSPMNRIQVDCFHLPHPKANLGCVYGLSVIDCFSKKAWVKPLKHIQAKDINRELKKIFDKEGRPKTLQSDNGPEFSSLKSLGVKVVHSRSHCPTSQAIVERFNGTIEREIGKYITQTGKKSYLKMLPKIVDRYNSSRSSSTGFVPDKLHVGSSDDIRMAYTKMADRAESRVSSKIPGEFVLQDGDRVRIQLKYLDASIRRDILQGVRKCYEPKFSSEIYTVKRRRKSHGMMADLYEIDGLKGYFPRGALLKI